MKNQAQLITYVDRLSGGTFRDLQRLLDGPFKGAFGGVHVLPFFHPIDGEDAGFDPIDHTQVDSRLGTWDDVAALARATDVMADVIVNHVSSRSPQFEDFHARGAESPFAGMFLSYSRVFPAGARESDLAAMHTPRSSLPFTKHRTARGQQVLLWTTFTSGQIDIDVEHPEGRRYLDGVLTRFQAAGIRAIRLDAVGHAIKKAGTSCFMIPETFAFIADITARARARGMDVLVEVHGHHLDQIEVARQVDWVYDFALPPLVLHTLYTRDATPLKRWLEMRPRNAVTVLDTHDGIGLQDAGADDRRPGVPGLLPAEAIDALGETIHQRSGGESRQASGTAASNVDEHHINCAFYDALGRRDDEYLVARAIQCFVPGIPQVYYVGLLAGGNDMELLRRTGVGRDINRHYYTGAELQRDLSRPVVRALLALLRFRNSHAAFEGACDLAPSAGNSVVLEWRNGAEWARLDVDLTRMTASITCSRPEAGGHAQVWRSILD
ncbi:MAG TPA: sucrose phosphorylase [Vicinamibacterales bacterium]|nr:sucrose phosphorylase [Vicinamibacterales bacterium]